MDRPLRRVGVILIGALLMACGCNSPLSGGPPVAPIRQVVDVYHGQSITDPYRYMENIKDPEVEKWIKGQADYARKVLDRIPGRARLLARLEELDSGAPYRIQLMQRRSDGTLYYLKTMAGENLARYYVRDGQSGREQLLIDPQTLRSPGGAHQSLSFCVPSPDGRFVMFGIAAAGSEATTLHVLDVKQGRLLPDTIDRMEAEYTWPAWLEDGSGFVYSRRQALAANAPPTDGYKNTRAYVHRLGQAPDSDPLILSRGSSAAVSLDETDFPSIVLSTGSSWMIGKIKHGDANELTLFAAPKSALALPADQIPWRKICDVADNVRGFAVHGDELFVVKITESSFPVLRMPLSDPDIARAQPIVPGVRGPANSAWIGVARDALYIDLREGGIMRTFRYVYGGTENKLELLDLPPGESSVSQEMTEPDVDGTLLISASWTRGSRIYSFDPAQRKLTETDLRPWGKFDGVEGYESVEAEVASHDGVRVPLSIMHKKGLKRDGSHPTLVVGYGGYGLSMEPGFDPMRLAWLERGGVIAVAHVRGGGELGLPWHLGGQKATKPNTWKDFIACCEYLIKEGYTSPAKLAGQGGSAGGILIGRAITERPDLFAAALIQVGCTDMLRMETTTNGVPNIPEFGSVATREGFEGLLAMSAYANVKNGVAYPAVLLPHGMNDPRVEPWMSAKMTARLQAATSSGKPILFRADFDSGHGIGSTRQQARSERADSWAFLLWQMNEPGFGRP